MKKIFIIGTICILLLTVLILVFTLNSCHKHEYTEVVTEPTCLKGGYTTYTCSCGDSYTDNETEALGHSYSDWVVVKEATEDEEGLKEKECSRCNDKITEEISKLEHTHNYTETVVDATCVDKGYKEFTCTCGDSYVSDETEAKGHTYSDWKVVKEATETEEGLKEKTCSVCNDKVSEAIAKLAHTHNYTETVVDATCTTKGYTTYTCSCGDTYKEEIEALGHTEVEVAGKEATCTEAGKTTGKKCSVCGEVTVPQTDINPLGHTYGEWKVVKEATETEEGLKEKECIRCKDKVTEEISKLEHTHTYTTIITEPTCTEKGYTTYTCTCGDSYKDNEVDALGHTYTSVVTEPTCTEKGYTTYTCSCGDTYKDDYTEIIEHEYIEISRKNPTCTDKGLKYYECSGCKKTLITIINKLNHNYVSGKCECGDTLMGTPFEENGYTYIYFGQYPQTVVTDESIISSLSTITTTNSKGYIEYNGNEYKKVLVSGLGTYYIFNNGNKIINGETYYFLVEPIKWRIISETKDSYQLLSEIAIDNIVFHHIYDQSFEYEGKTIYPSNYEYSNIRAWLNGYDGSSYNVDNYTKNGFYDIAFSNNEKDIINNTYLDNSLISTLEQDVKFAVNDTIDKVYLLSHRDLINSNYGYSDDPTQKDSLRATTSSDYARSIGCYLHLPILNNGGNTYWILRNVRSKGSIVSAVNQDGLLDYGKSVSEKRNGVRPAITIIKDGHTHSYTSSIINPTCTNKGYTIYKCNCGNCYIQNITDLLGHTYESIVTKPTCTADGYTIYTCSICGDTYTDNYTNKLDHNYISGKCECGDILMEKPYEENGYTYINLGKYPQSVVTDESIISSLSTISSTNSLGYIEYNGNEYKKLVASTYNSVDYNFINDTLIINGNTYYYLVEPIKWRVITEDDNSYTLMCEMVIDNTNFYNTYDERIIDEETIYANNYEYSNIRAWLNGYNGSNYNVTDYTNIGFYDIAFTKEEKTILNTTLIDNSAKTTNNSINIYACNNTYDKVYLLSYQDMINLLYGFLPSYESDKAKMCQPTDYARSKGCWMNKYYLSYDENANWWLRSSGASNYSCASIVSYDGHVHYNYSVTSSSYGVRPAITISK